MHTEHNKNNAHIAKHKHAEPCISHTNKKKNTTKHKDSERDRTQRRAATKHNAKQQEDTHQNTS